MGKKKKISKLSNADDEKLSKLSMKERAIAVDGEPDQSDLYNLQDMFIAYDKATGGGLKRFFNELAVERAFIKDMKPIEKAERFKYSFPVELEGEVRKWFPSIWTNEKHTRWFLKHFPGFRAG